MECDLELKELKEFVESEKFIQFLLNNNTNITIPAFIVQTLLEKIDELLKEED